MDIILLIFHIILILILFLVYQHTNVGQTSDLLTIFKELSRHNTSISSFSTGYYERKKKYKNVYLISDKQEEYKLQEKWEFLPVDLHGNLLDLSNTHGTVVPLNNNGYTVSGIEKNMFACPNSNNFEGLKCTQKAACTSPNDDNKWKPLTRYQFHRLNRLATKEESINLDEMHPRLKIQCLPENKYKLVQCAENELVDTFSLNCVPYDICKNKLSGFKHKFRINATQGMLNENEYYTCKNNKSELSTCSDNMVYSREHQTCIVKSECFNRGNDTLHLDEQRYIACKNNMGRIIDCGKITESTLPAYTYETVDFNSKVTYIESDKDGRLNCKHDICIPKVLSYKDDILSFNYGIKQCNEDGSTKKEVVCDITPNHDRESVFSYAWGEPFNYTIKHWPTTVLDMETLTCVKPTKEKIISPYSDVMLAWSSVMSEPHKYNLAREEYVCDGYQYQWNYKNNTIDPPIGVSTSTFNASTHFIDSAKPCQDTLRQFASDHLFHGVVSKPLGPDNAPPLFYYANINTLLNIKTMWPSYSKAKGGYLTSFVKYDYTNDVVIAETYLDVHSPPAGFFNAKSKEQLNDNDIIPLHPIGWITFFEDIKKHGINLNSEIAWFGIYTGELNHFKVNVNSAVLDSSHILPTSSPITLSSDKLSQQYYRYILWDKYKNDEYMLHENFILTKYGVKTNGKIIDAGIYPLNLQVVMYKQEKKIRIRVEYREALVIFDRNNLDPISLYP